MIRVVIDTSVLVSAVISPTGPNAQLFDFIASKQLRPYVTQALLNEY
jgi:putative PIN family toxin of toxin-antitoxin system